MSKHICYFNIKDAWVIIVVKNIVILCQDYVILDEGHKIKNPSNKCAKGVHSIPAKNRIVLTGTPVMNNLKVTINFI